MDLFPKDYKKNNAPIAAPSAGTGFLAWWSKLKNQLAGGNNFLPSSRLREAVWRLGVLVSVAAFALVAAGWGGLYFYKKSLADRISELKSRQAGVFSSQDKEMAAKIVGLDQTAAVVQTLLKNHVYTSELFNKLGEATLPRVQWRALDLLVRDKKLTLKGFSADYATLAKQLLALNAGAFSNVAVSGITLDKTGGVSFVVTLDFDPKILLKQ